jgi:ParB family transcriptional regulator, chromosome partitioning protein
MWLYDGKVLDGRNRYRARLAEIDENLIRNELSELEQALQLAERKEIYEALHPETKHGGDRKSKEKSKRHDVALKTFAEDTAKKTGKSKRTVERKARVGKKLKGVADKLKGTAIEDNQKELLKLSNLSLAEQQKVVEKLSVARPRG